MAGYKRKISRMLSYQSVNISQLKLDETIIWKISQCLANQRWIEVGRELQIAHGELDQINENYKEWRERAYRMLILWNQRRPSCLLQNLFSALVMSKWEEPIPKITRRIKMHLISLPSNSIDIPNKWNNLDTWILQSILLKMPLKYTLKCCQISKNWHENAFVSWMTSNRANWTKSSFRNTMENSVSQQDIYWTCSKGWEMTTAPTLIKEIRTKGGIHDIKFSSSGTLLAVCYNYNITIYDTKDFRERFARDFSDQIYSYYFNTDDSCILVNTGDEKVILAITEGLPILQVVKCHTHFGTPWWSDNIFLSVTYNEEDGRTTFYLNEIPEAFMSHPRNIQCPILMAKGEVSWGTVFKTGSCMILICGIDETKLEFTTFHEIDLVEFKNKDTNRRLRTLDLELNCMKDFWDFTMVPDGNAKKIYVLTEVEEMDYCFMVFDLNSFKLKTSTLLVPIDFRPVWRNLDSNEKYIACGSLSKYVYVWDLKSGLCVAQIGHEIAGVICRVHPVDTQLVITAGQHDEKIRLWRMNTDRIKYR